MIRPPGDHPNPEHWAALQKERRILQTYPGSPHAQCGSCWRTEDKYPFDLHHRHYTNHGKELIHEVVLLCRHCHDAITSQIRWRRRAAGDTSQEILDFLEAHEQKCGIRETRKQLKIATGTQQQEFLESCGGKPTSNKRPKPVATALDIQKVMSILVWLPTRSIKNDV